MGRQRAAERSEPKEQGLFPFHRTVVVSRALAAPYSEVARAARHCLPQLVASALPWQRSLPYDLVAAVSPTWLRPFLRVPVDLEYLRPLRSGDGVVAHLHWRGHRFGRLFPVMDADLVARPVAGGLTEVMLVGSYCPPFGVLGVAGDVLAGRNVARSTARAFLEQVAVALERALQEGHCSAEHFHDARGAA
ncbi:MAG TPA: hypothetical protein VE991_14595 [Acidimicrobiales bacterium]|nr:hypothetical protein [Acidimicrobiales bacterium]